MSVNASGEAGPKPWHHAHALVLPCLLRIQSLQQAHHSARPGSRTAVRQDVDHAQNQHLGAWWALSHDVEQRRQTGLLHNLRHLCQQHTSIRVSVAASVCIFACIIFCEGFVTLSDSGVLQPVTLGNMPCPIYVCGCWDVPGKKCRPGL